MYVLKKCICFAPINKEARFNSLVARLHLTMAALGLKTGATDISPVFIKWLREILARSN